MSDEADTPEPKGNKKKLGLIVGGVVVLLGAVGGGLWASGMLGGGGEGHEAAAEGEGEAPAEGEGHGEAKAEGEGHGEAKAEGEHGAVASEGASAVSDGIGGSSKAGSVITNLGSFTVNLRGSGGGRVLRMEVQLDSNSTTAALVGARSPQLRDSVITAVSDYTWSELEGVDGKTRLRDELLARLNGVVTPNVVDHLYFTQFVVQ